MEPNSASDQAGMGILELEHVVGYNGKFPDTIQYIPNSKNSYVYPIGGLVVIEDINDKHNQRFLKGHDMPISALAVSASGKYLATGQLGTIFAKIDDAPVILWDIAQARPINIFKGLRGGVRQLAFSPDDQFLAAYGDNNYFMIWSCRDFGLISSKVSETPLSQICWGEMKKIGKHPLYTLITTNPGNVFINMLEFDLGSLQYQLKTSFVQLPSSGLIRNYTCAKIDPTGQYFYAGTTGGEVCIFNIPNKIFKATLPVSNNGVYSLAVLKDSLIIGSGDGRVKKLVGEQTKYVLDKEILLEGRIMSLAVSADNAEILVGSSNGRILRTLVADLSTAVSSEGHVEHIAGVAFQKGKTDIFATIDVSGVILVWDINTLNVVTKCTTTTTPKPKGRCICIADDGTVVSGWQDGFIRCFEVTNNKTSGLKWEIVNAHRGSVTCIYVDENYILSGGEDAIVRVWSRKVRQLVTQINPHKKEISRVFPDLEKPHVIHSCSIDKIIHTYDLKTEKKVIMHQAKNGQVLDMAQRKDSELELVTCGLNNPITYWDCDVVEPVDSIDYPYKLLTIDVSPSGKYLAVGSETAEVLIFEVATKSFMGKFDGHSGPITSLKFTPDEKQIISVSTDSSLCIWNFFG